MHILIVGGTGMLKGVIEQYANTGHNLTLLARNRKKLNQLKDINPQKINIIATDYIQTEAAIIKVQEAIKQSGKIDLAILWIHSTGDEFKIKLKELLIITNPFVKVFELIGSATRNPMTINTDNLLKFNSTHYRRIVLGYKFSNHQFRWLTDEEICEGTLYAIKKDEPLHIIGEADDNNDN